MKKYLLFDLDGTLSDPKVGICTCVQYALASFGIEEPDLDKLEPFIGPPLKESFMKFYNLSDKQGDAAVAKYRERFSDVGLFENVVYPGIPELLKELSGKGYTLAVASSKPTVYVKRILEHFKIDKYFKVVVGSELDGRRVNKDEVVREALRQLFDNGYVNREEVYMIGDRRFDVEGAHALGIESVAVSYGYGSMKELKEAKSDYIVRSVRELRRFLLRGADELKKTTLMQRLLPIFFPYIMFLLVKSLAAGVVELLFVTLGGSVNGPDFLFVRNAEGVIEGLSGNASTIATGIGFVAAALFFFQKAKSATSDAADDMWITHLKPEPKKRYVLLGFATIGAVIGLNLLLELLGVTADASYQAVAEVQFAAALPVGLICYGIITPIAEEILFRGIIYNNTKRYMKPTVSLFVSAAIFALYHENQVQGLYALAMGALITYAYEYFGKFRVAVAIHMAANILVYLLSYFADAIPGFVGWGPCLIGLFWAVGGVYFLNKEKEIY